MINILSIGFQIPGLPKTSRYVILGSLFLRIGEYLFRLIELHHFSHIEKRRLITDTGRLLHIMRNDYNLSLIHI